MRINMSIVAFSVASALMFYALGLWLNGDPLRTLLDPRPASHTEGTAP